MPFLASAQSIDAETSYVKFGVSNMMIRTVNGTIKGMQGKVIFDEKSPNTASFDVCVSMCLPSIPKVKRGMIISKMKTTFMWTSILLFVLSPMLLLGIKMAILPMER